MTWEHWIAVAAGIFCTFGIGCFVLAIIWRVVRGGKAAGRLVALPQATPATPGSSPAAELLAAGWEALQREGVQRAFRNHASTMADQVAADVAAKFAAASPPPKDQPPAS